MKPLGGFRRFWPLLLLGLALTVVSFNIGQYPVRGADLFKLALHWIFGIPHDLPPVVETVVLQVRLPRIAGALLVGAALAAAGATYQGMFRNPLVSPDILGVSSGPA